MISIFQVIRFFNTSDAILMIILCNFITLGLDHHILVFSFTHEAIWAVWENNQRCSALQTQFLRIKKYIVGKRWPALHPRHLTVVFFIFPGLVLETEITEKALFNAGYLWDFNLNLLASVIWSSQCTFSDRMLSKFNEHNKIASVANGINP